MTGYEQFEGWLNFYAGDKALEGIRNYYENIFQYKIKNKKNEKDKEFKKQVHLLIIDEYSSILDDLSNSEKEDLKKMIRRISKMGRSLNCFIWIGEQKAYQQLFEGSRNNFTIIIGLGNLDKEQQQMLFSRYKERMTKENGTGEGYIYISGRRY